MALLGFAEPDFDSIRTVVPSIFEQKIQPAFDLGIVRSDGDWHHRPFARYCESSYRGDSSNRSLTSRLVLTSWDEWVALIVHPEPLNGDIKNCVSHLRTVRCKCRLCDQVDFSWNQHCEVFRKKTPTKRRNASFGTSCARLESTDRSLQRITVSSKCIRHKSACQRPFSRQATVSEGNRTGRARCLASPQTHQHTLKSGGSEGLLPKS